MGLRVPRIPWAAPCRRTHRSWNQRTTKPVILSRVGGFVGLFWGGVRSARAQRKGLRRKQVFVLPQSFAFFLALAFQMLLWLACLIMAGSKAREALRVGRWLLVWLGVSVRALAVRSRPSALAASTKSFSAAVSPRCSNSSSSASSCPGDRMIWPAMITPLNHVS